MRECDVEPSAALELPERNEEEEHCDRAESPWTNDQDEAVAEVTHHTAVLFSLPTPLICSSSARR